jgi:maltose O-acetyltransferase
LHVPDARSRRGGLRSAVALLRASSLRRLWRRAHGWPDVEGLERAGLRIGRNVFVGGGTFLDPDFCHLITIGDDAVISIDVMVLAHDASTRRSIGYSRVAAVTIGDRVFVGARAVILPGVTIGADAIVGAGSVVSRDVPAGAVVAGSPARQLTTTAAYTERHRARLGERPVWDRGWSVGGGITPADQERMRRALQDGAAYIR